MTIKPNKPDYKGFALALLHRAEEFGLLELADVTDFDGEEHYLRIVDNETRRT